MESRMCPRETRIRIGTQRSSVICVAGTQRARVAVSMREATSAGCETMMEWEAPCTTIVFLECERSYMNFMAAGGMLRSAVP